MQEQYQLKVLRAQKVQWKPGFHSKLPDLYVEVEINNQIRKTQIYKKSISPEWDETLSLSISAPDSPVVIIVKHKSSIFSNPNVARVDTTVSELLEKSRAGDAELKLIQYTGNNITNISSGSIFLRLSKSDVINGIDNLIRGAQKDVRRSGFVKSAEGAESVPVRLIEGTAAHVEEYGDLYDAFGSLVEKLDVLVGVIDAISEIHPYLNVACTVVTAAYKIISKQFETDGKVVLLVQTMSGAFAFVQDTQILKWKLSRVESTIIQILRQITECTLFVRDYTTKGFARRMITVGVSDKIDEFLSTLAELKKSLDSDISLSTSIVSSRTSEMVEELVLRQRLKPSFMDAFDRPICLRDTCLETRQAIISRLLSDTEQNIVWLSGVAGCGKSTISNTVAKCLTDIMRLGAYLFFERGKSEPSTVIRTIAFKLALFDGSIGTHIRSSIEQSIDIASSSAANQFERLLLRPLTEAANDVHGPVVIILDALDECGTWQSRRNLMRLIKDDLSRLPKNFRFLITSRPENDITNAFSPTPDWLYHIELDYTSKNIHKDVLTYLKYELDLFFKEDGDIELPEGWPWDENMELLGNAADGLFIWAATAIKLIKDSDDPLRKLEGLVSNSRSLSGKGFGLDKLYDTVLKDSGISWDDETSASRFSQVLSFVLFSKTTITDTIIDKLLGLPSHLTLRRLKSVLAYEPGKSVRLFHTSFADYLVSPKQAGKSWSIDLGREKYNLVSKCFDMVKEKLIFNLCELQSSLLPNDSVTGLQDRIVTKIPSYIEYSCLYWAQHLSDIPFSENVLNLLEHFLHNNLLSWFEVLSLLKKFDRASSALLYAIGWVSSHSTNTLEFLRDARKLSTIFAAPITHSTPHIYMSMIPFMQDDSVVAKHYFRPDYSIVEIRHTGVRPVTPLLKVIEKEGRKSRVNRIAFSPDSQRIASAMEDWTICVWNVETGNISNGPFHGHEDNVFSVAFSPDGSRIASGSADETIRIWDAENGIVLSGPCMGHSGIVWCVVFSPDGKRVYSSSEDSTIRIWDSQTGDLMGIPLTGHNSAVRSISISPDGKSLVSGSRDGTVRVWDLDASPITSFTTDAHDDGVLSVAFSPDGSRIVSGCSDNKIRVFESKSGKLLLGPLKGHTREVWSVAYSQDGSRIASSSLDYTALIWDAHTGAIISGPLEGHRAVVIGVAFSPDCTRVASCSWDCTIRLWDATEKRKMDSGPVYRHTSAVSAVSFSPDKANQIISASYDETLWVWDSETSQAINGPIKVHDAGIYSLAYSPDGTRLISASADMKLLETQNWSVIPIQYKGHTNSIRCVSFSKDGKRIVSGSYDSTIFIWDVGTGEPVCGPLEGHTDVVRSVAFSLSGDSIISGSEDNTLKLWDVYTGKELASFEGHFSWVTSVCFSPDGTYVASASEDWTIGLWDWSERSDHEDDTISELIPNQRLVLRGHEKAVTSIAFSPPSSSIVRLASSSEDHTIRIWEPSSGEQLLVLGGHTLGVLCVAFSSDGSRLVSGGRDFSIRVWDVQVKSDEKAPSERMSIAAKTDNNSTRSNWYENFKTAVNKSLNSWELREDGWVESKEGDLLVWVPPDLRRTLWHSRNTGVLSCQFSTRLNFRT